MHKFKTMGGFIDLCRHIRSSFDIKGIIIYATTSILIVGWPQFGMSPDNDNEAKP